VYRDSIYSTYCNSDMYFSTFQQQFQIAIAILTSKELGSLVCTSVCLTWLLTLQQTFVFAITIYTANGTNESQITHLENLCTPRAFSRFSCGQVSWYCHVNATLIRWLYSNHYSLFHLTLKHYQQRVTADLILFSHFNFRITTTNGKQ
jgi:hypothetical protein